MDFTWHDAHSQGTIHAVHHLPGTVYSEKWREHFSKVPDAIKVKHVLTQVGCNNELQSSQDPSEGDETKLATSVVLRYKTAHFRVTSYCDRPKAHLCYNDVV